MVVPRQILEDNENRLQLTLESGGFIHFLLRKKREREREKKVVFLCLALCIYAFKY